jgi:signal transduction histidine kinase
MESRLAQIAGDRQIRTIPLSFTHLRSVMAALLGTVLEFSRSLVILAAVLLAHVLADRPARPRWRSAVLAAAYALAGVLGMLMPIHLAPGYLFDLRAAVIGLAVLFIGPVSGLFVVAVLGALRLYLSGSGAWTGIGAITVAYLAALAVRFAAARLPRQKQLLLLAIAEAGANMSWLSAMLPATVVPFSFVAAQGVALLFGTLLLGTALQLDAARRGAQAEALVARDAAEAANQAKTVFLAHMSHELRTPLNAVIGFAEALQFEALSRDPARVRDYGLHIARAGTHLRFIVSDLLDLARIESGRLELHEEEFTPQELLESVRGAVVGQAERAGIAFECSSNLEGRLHADPHRLAQVLINLATNAIDATSDGWVRLSCSADAAGNVLFRVADTGEGMPPDAIPQLLHPFNQRGSALVRRKQGSIGIGLPLSRTLVELHGGRLDIESNLGAGTVATVTLPPTARRPAVPAA